MFTSILATIASSFKIKLVLSLIGIATSIFLLFKVADPILEVFGIETKRSALVKLGKANEELKVAYSNLKIAKDINTHLQSQLVRVQASYEDQLRVIAELQSKAINTEKTISTLIASKNKSIRSHNATLNSKTKNDGKWITIPKDPYDFQSTANINVLHNAYTELFAKSK